MSPSPTCRLAPVEAQKDLVPIQSGHQPVYRANRTGSRCPEGWVPLVECTTATPLSGEGNRHGQSGRHRGEPLSPGRGRGDHPDQGSRCTIDPIKRFIGLESPRCLSPETATEDDGHENDHRKKGSRNKKHTILQILARARGGWCIVSA